MLLDRDGLTKDLKSVENALLTNFKKLRTGKPKSDAVTDIKVEAYPGSFSTIQSIAQVYVEQTTIVITPFDKGTCKEIAKALTEANLGASPKDDGSKVYLTFTPMTQEIRDRVVSQMKEMVEEARKDMRQVRQLYKQDIEDMEGVSEDLQKSELAELQKRIDEFNDKLATLARTKEVEIRDISSK
jgi:ribosome recycling factor